MNICKHTLLIVDDVSENIKFLGELLKDQYSIRIAKNGETALLIANSDSPPDLILLDIVMPEMDGYEVCRRLKNNPLTKNIPVIFITSKTNDLDEVEGFQVGAVDYIAKPFNPIVVRARVNTHSELKRYKDSLVNSSYTDGLTCLANRRKFDEEYQNDWELLSRSSSEMSIIMIDIDHFKQYNDCYGHIAGDDCLIKIAKRFSQLVKRKSDLICRYGGEEFICILPNTNSESAITLAETLRKEVLNLEILHEASITDTFVSVSIGVATAISKPNMLPKTLIHEADKALYFSKNNGRNKVTFNHNI